MTEEPTIIEKLKSKSLSKCEKEWDILIASNAVTEEREKFFRDLAPTAVIPGFRKGKAPLPILAQHFREEAKTEIAQRLLRRSVREALNREKDDIIHFPSLSDIQYDGDRLSFKVVIELRPKIKLPRYQSFQIKRAPFELKEEEITKVIERMREKSATFVPVSDRAAQMGDYIIADYSLAINTQEKEKRSDEIFELKEELLLPGFAQQIVGMNPGETRKVVVDLPKTFPRTEWAGSQATFALTLKEIKLKHLPEPDDNWAVSISNFKSVKEIRDQIRRDLTHIKERDCEQMFERAILDELVNKARFDLAEGTIQRRYDHLAQQNMEHLVTQGYSQERAESLTKEKAGEIRKEAERQIRISLIFNEIAKVESISITDETLSAEIERLANSSRSSEAVRRTYADADHREALRDQIRFEKVLEFVKSNIGKS